MRQLDIQNISRHQSLTLAIRAGPRRMEACMGKPMPSAAEGLSPLAPGDIWLEPIHGNADNRPCCWGATHCT